MNLLKASGVAILILLQSSLAGTQSTAAQAADSHPAAGAQPKVVSLTGNLEEDDLISVKVDHLA